MSKTIIAQIYNLSTLTKKKDKSSTFVTLSSAEICLCASSSIAKAAKKRRGYYLFLSPVESRVADGVIAMGADAEKKFRTEFAKVDHHHKHPC